MVLFRKLFEYLFYKYYFFQVKVGNQDVAKYTSIIIIAFILNFYFIISLLLIDVFFEIYFTKMSTIGFITGFIFVLLFLYIGLVHNGKYKKIINDENLKKSNNLLAMLFPIIGFLFICFSLFLKMLQNQGKL
jgi:hypothetical protein